MKFVAITACPTGIAHSQMAAENLEQTAEKRGHDIHVEIHGAMGTENEIPDDTLAAADAVIIAADTGVQRDRFQDHIVVKGTVKDGVNDAEGLIDEAVERVEAAGGGTETETTVDETTGTESEAGTADPTGTESTQTAEPDQSTTPESTDSDSGVLARLKRLFS
ncbi:PTS fructose transporter subunit IIB [Halohasta litorea]|uniref:PTS fructose transporter subunit IIB n=1 Tax=Halohasta litorea TaxID=869891 RepID=A0ABD6DCD5_9EURY|nr:PTS fructose transporter subunit IIB [Halohasta litorea]